MLVATIVGARPQFIKAATVSRQLAAREIAELLIHTGQHYDLQLSDVFFNELGLPEPQYNLAIGSAGHGRQTGQMLIALEEVLLRHEPDVVVVYGDTNSTLAGALAAAKLKLPLVHVEAGMRSGDRSMPEEINRVATDHVSNLLLCATQTAVENLKLEGLRAGVHLTGDVMCDLLLWAGPRFRPLQPALLERLGLRDREYVAATLHRPRNTDNAERLTTILDTLRQLDEPVVLPLHPRTRQRLSDLGKLDDYQSILSEPLGYLEMQALLAGARLLVTDSGGLQKEAYLHQTPCLTVMPQTEWRETVEVGWNRLVAPWELTGMLEGFTPPAEHPPLFGDGRASARVADILQRFGRVHPADS
jgi:UDP-N-acetylglucosamine 2-epimerase